jgi:hypothetical protein
MLTPEKISIYELPRGKESQYARPSTSAKIPCQNSQYISRSSLLVVRGGAGFTSTVGRAVFDICARSAMLSVAVRVGRACCSGRRARGAQGSDPTG